MSKEAKEKLHSQKTITKYDMLKGGPARRLEALQFDEQALTKIKNPSFG